MSALCTVIVDKAKGYLYFIYQIGPSSTRSREMNVRLTEHVASDTSDGVFGRHAALSLADSPPYQSLMRDVSGQLRHLDLKLLATQDEKLSFYGNLINIMAVHAFVLEVQRQSFMVRVVKTLDVHQDKYQRVN